MADRNAVEGLRGCKLLTKREALPEPEDDEVYLEDLGGDVFLPDGKRLGRLDHFEEYPAGLEVWVIMTDDDREVLFPARPGIYCGL